MKLNYFPDTDSLYIDLSHKQSTESQEVSEGVVLDYDAEGNLVGIDIDHASQKLNLRELVSNHAADERDLRPEPRGGNRLIRTLAARHSRKGRPAHGLPRARQPLGLQH